MSKICEYNCEHNKSGVCQISVCDKKLYMLDKTETESFRETWYNINQIRQLQQENKQLKDNWNKLKEWLNVFHKLSEFQQWEIVDKMQELEKGNDNNE